MGFNLGKMVSGIGVLIMAYLLLSNSNATAKIIETFASNSIYGIKTLQGRG